MERREAVKISSELMVKAKIHCSMQGSDLSEYIEDLIRRDLVEDMIKGQHIVKDKRLIFKKE